jgi:hypothetical protein
VSHVFGKIDERSDERILVVGALDEAGGDLRSVVNGTVTTPGWARPHAIVAGTVAIARPEATTCSQCSAFSI